jgi:acyl CoA:acetate/3-ketoacid CoA transferase beta subunit
MMITDLGLFTVDETGGTGMTLIEPAASGTHDGIKARTAASQNDVTSYSASTADHRCA